MDISENIAGQIWETMMASEKVLIMSHRNPDPDTLGSNLTLRKVLENKGKHVVSACIDPVPASCQFLPELRTFVPEIEPSKFDLFISVDAGSLKQAGYPDIHPEILKKKFINIDHHPSNNLFGTINLVVDDAASTTLILYHTLKTWNVEITPYIATLLLYGLYYDTGSFMHSNTDSTVYGVAAKLLELGARQDMIVKNLFKSHTVPQMKLWGKALENATLTENRVIVAGLTMRDFAECQASQSDISGLIDYLSTTKGSRFATLLSNDDNEVIKGSFRTRRDDINVGGIAENLGGGGHRKASGFSLKGKLKRKSSWAIVSEER